MNRWLVKEEPAHYAFEDLRREGRTAWTGVHNALAQRHLWSMHPGDLVFYYHSGPERAIVGVARVASSPRIDPRDARGAPFVELVPVRPLPRAVSLSEVRGDPSLSTMLLVRLPRLSVQPVTPRQWRRIEARSRSRKWAPSRPVPERADRRPPGAHPLGSRKDLRVPLEPARHSAP